ncbi:hypothetical protein C8J57DRAFT_1253341 [Mycena rebaudengoi]|nr:hypothetical protein C8J57DRAFT_1253341 [Mycena rebaudengoi]
MHDADFAGADGWADLDSDEEEALREFPRGEEGMLLSHTGQEVAIQQVMEGIKPGRGDLRICDDRVQKVVDSWMRQMPVLVDVYLEFKYKGTLNSEEAEVAWGIPVIGFDENDMHRFAYMAPSQTANVALLLHGYLGSAPEKPGLAFLLRLFEVYQQLHRVCPQFSLDALSKTLTHLHEPAHKLLSAGWGAGMDNVCAPCFYKTVNEPHILFSWLGTMDGNNSLKLVDPMFCTGAPRLDNRKSAHHCWISLEDVHTQFGNDLYQKKNWGQGVHPHRIISHRPIRGCCPITGYYTVDEFKDEVTNSQKNFRGLVGGDLSICSTCINGIYHLADAHPPIPPTGDMDGDIAWLDVNELESMDDTELAKCINTCVDRWWNAGLEQHKKMYALFTVAGIFLVVCHHGHVVVMCDMICSGELMKYPLAMVKRILDRYGKDIGLGYDIISLSSRVVTMNLHGVVLVFHGHAHNRALDGIHCTLMVSGLRILKSVNAPLQNQTTLHRISSGNFIYQNYRQAIEKIAINHGQLDIMEAHIGTTAKDYECDLCCKQEYFHGLRSEPAEVSSTVQYVELLMKLQAHFDESEAAKVEYRQLDHNIVYNNYNTPEIAREQKYKQAVSELEWLVVQRLFELMKLGMSGVGYKLREKLSRVLKTRAEAIRKSLERYNAAAAALDPPRPRLSWNSIVRNADLAEFDWLHETQQDIRELAWTQPVCREAMLLHFGIKRAEEEKTRLNVEIRCLITAMLDDHDPYFLEIVKEVLKLTTVTVKYEEPQDNDTMGMTEVEQRNYHAQGLAREEEFDENLVVDLMESLSMNDSM